MVYCQECGTENVGHANFCSNCGTKIDIPNNSIKLNEGNRGIVGYLDLTEWFDSLSETEKGIIRGHYKNSRAHSSDVDSGEFLFTTQTQTQFLHGIANILSKTEGENRKIEILIDALNAEGTATNKHFVYNDLIEIYGKKADFKTTLHYCQSDIELIENDEDAKKFLKDCVIPSIDYISRINEYKNLIKPLKEIFDKNDVIVQKDLYKYPEFTDKKQTLSSFLYWLDRGNYIIRSKKGNSYEVKLKVPLNELF